MRYALLLREKESGDMVYYGPGRYPKAMLCIVYYEKLKSIYLGKTFLSLGLRVEAMDGNGVFLILENGGGECVKATPVGDEVYEVHYNCPSGQYGQEIRTGVW